MTTTAEKMRMAWIGVLLVGIGTRWAPAGDVESFTGPRALIVRTSDCSPAGHDTLPFFHLQVCHRLEVLPTGSGGAGAARDVPTGNSSQTHGPAGERWIKVRVLAGPFRGCEGFIHPATLRKAREMGCISGDANHQEGASPPEFDQNIRYRVCGPSPLFETPSEDARVLLEGAFIDLKRVNPSTSNNTSGMSVAARMYLGGQGFLNEVSVIPTGRIRFVNDVPWCPVKITDPNDTRRDQSGWVPLQTMGLTETMYHPQTWALVVLGWVGKSDDKGQRWRLACRRNVDRLKAGMISRWSCSEETYIPLISDQPQPTTVTREAVLDGLDRIALGIKARRDPDTQEWSGKYDTVVFFYLGHGAKTPRVGLVFEDSPSRPESDKYFYSPKNMENDFRSLEMTLGGAEAKTVNKVIILTSCHGGGFRSIVNQFENTYFITSTDADTLSPGDMREDGDWLDDVTSEIDRLVSAHRQGTSLSPVWPVVPEGNLFAYWFAEGLQTGRADTNRDDRVSLREAYDYTVKEGKAHPPKGREHQDWFRPEMIPQGQDLCFPR